MSFSVVNLHDMFNGQKSPNVWLGMSTTKSHQIRDVVKVNESEYEIVFYSRPSMMFKENDGATSTYTISYVTPILQNQVARKVTLSSIEVGALLFLTDGMFQIESYKYGEINITHNGKVSEKDVKCLHIIVHTRFGKRLCLYTYDKNGYLSPLIKHHEIMGIYKRSSYLYVPTEIDGSKKEWFPPLARSVYDYETTYIAALGSNYKETASEMSKNNVYDNKLQNVLRSVRSEASYTIEALGEPKYVYALSMYIKEEKPSASTTSISKGVTTTTVVAKVATVPYKAMYEMIEKLKAKPVSGTAEV